MPLLGSRGSSSARGYGLFGKIPPGLFTFTFTGATQDLIIPAAVVMELLFGLISQQFQELVHQQDLQDLARL